MYSWSATVLKGKRIQTTRDVFSFSSTKLSMRSQISIAQDVAWRGVTSHRQTGRTSSRTDAKRRRLKGRIKTDCAKLVNMVLNVHRRLIRNGEKGGRGMEVGEEGDYIPIAILSPPE